MNFTKIILAALVIYGAGVVTGTYVDALRPAPPERRAPRDPMPRGPRLSRLMERLESKLDLSAGQKSGIEAIMKASQDRMHAIMTETQPLILEEFQSVDQAILALLDEKQAAAYQEMMEARRNGPPGGGRGGFGGGPPRGERRRPDRGPDHEHGRLDITDPADTPGGNPGSTPPAPMPKESQEIPEPAEARPVEDSP